MKKTKIVTLFSRMPDGAVEDLGLAVATAMTGNANFPEPIPTLVTLNDAIKAFSDALAHADSRDKVKVSIKNDRRTELEIILRHLSDYCHYVAHGDRTILISSGFPVSSGIVSPRSLSSPQNFTTEPGYQPGEVIVSVKKDPNAKGYLFLYGPAPVENDLWKHVPNSVPYATITGLEQGKQYSFKICIMGSKGQLMYSDTITKIV